MGNWLYILKKNNIQSLPNPSSFVNVNIKKQYKLNKMPGYSMMPQQGQMSAGFDQSGLAMDKDLGDPRRQMGLPGGYATQGQAVSAPYAEANMKAAEKTNPMNAASQETPVGDRVDNFLKKMGG